MEATILVLLAALASASPQDSAEPESEEEVQKHQREGADDEDIDVSADDIDTDAELPEQTVEFYGSARFVAGSSGDGLQARDNLSRAGLFAAKDVSPGYSVYARLELGVNLIEAFDRLLNPKASGPEGSNGVVPRLGYMGVETPFGQLSFGKQWSAYWPVAAFTDRFSFSGGLANASFNARTDGGATGTGRADGAFKYQLELSGTHVRFQWQPGERNVPLTEMSRYDYGLGASVFYRWDDKLSFGTAFNYAPIVELTDDASEVGLNGPSQAFLLGVMYKDEPLYVGVNYVQHRNHAVDDEGRYYDGEGFEVYARLAIRRQWRAVGGINYLTPFRRPFGGSYDLRLGFLGVERSLLDDSFRNSIYAQWLIDESLRADGSKFPHAFVVGFRLGLEI